jgi:hypothetical protein
MKLVKEVLLKIRKDCITFNTLVSLDQLLYGYLEANFLYGPYNSSLAVGSLIVRTVVNEIPIHICTLQ